MRPLFLKEYDETPLRDVEPVRGHHYSYCRRSQRSTWRGTHPTMSTTQTFSGNASISDDNHGDSE